MGYFEHNFEIGLKDVEKYNKLSNKAILSFFEDAGAYHSDSINFGLNDIVNTHLSWVLLGWKVKVLKRPVYGDKLHIKTWARSPEKFSTYRDFEVYNQNNELAIIATSKWVLVNTETGRISAIPEDVINNYKPDTKSVFSDSESEIKKLSDSKKYSQEINYTVTRPQIDVNKHLHNIFYLDIANEALPENIYENNLFDNFEIMYKKQIRLHDTVKSCYCLDEDTHKVVIKSLDDKKIHAIVILK